MRYIHFAVGILVILCCVRSAFAQGRGSESTPANVEEVTTEAETETTGALFPVERPFYQWEMDRKKEMSDKYGLNWAVEWTTIYQHTSGGIEHDQAAESTFSIYTLWKFLRAANDIDGTAVGFQLESRSNHMSDNFLQMTEDLGTLWSPNDSTSDNYTEIKQLWLANRMADGKLTLLAGKIDPGAHMNRNRFAGSGNGQFFSQPLATNPGRAFPENGLGALVRVQPVDWLYVHGVISDSEADSNYSPFKTVEGNWFYGGELGLMPKVPNLGEGNYRFMLWQRNTEVATTDSGFSLSFDQNLGEKFGTFLRYAVNSGNLNPVEQIAATGISFLAPLGRVDDEAGIGFSWTKPSDHVLRDEYAGEIYYRLQLTDGIELSASAQVIVNPSDSNQNVEGVYGMRLRFLF